MGASISQASSVICGIRDREFIMTYQTILAEKRGRAMLLTLNRPEALNAINSTLTKELIEAAVAADRDPDIGCIVITGSQKAFAAGADIREMSTKTYGEMYGMDRFSEWDRFNSIRKPIIAAVAGYALGGGCELAMMCDFILAGDNAMFGQPEIKLGIIPGMGGSQRLARYIGKAKANEMCMTGRMMDAQEAERCGLVSRIVPKEKLVEDALATAETIGGMSLPSMLLLKESLNRCYETTLAEGVRFERRVFHSLFSTEDQKEGMAAFVEKRPAKFKHG